MSGGVCPACGVAVVPGYVRCPKCHAPLPRANARLVEGGTALPDRRRFPLVAVVIAALIGAAVIVFLGVRGGGKPAPKAAEAPRPTAPAAAQPTPIAAAPAPPTAPSRPPPGPVASRLEQNLNKQRLWSTVEVVGSHVDIHSSSCADPAMAPLVDGAAPALKAAGLTKLRCLEQSGRVVSDRDL